MSKYIQIIVKSVIYNLATDIRLKLDIPPASPDPFFGQSAKKRAEKKRQLGTRGGGEFYRATI